MKMNKQEILNRVHKTGIVPVVRAANIEEAIALVEAIRAGGIDVFEITMTVPGAVKVIEQLSDRFSEDVVIGAGTVLDQETARACILAGARFIVSPSLNTNTIELCNRYSIGVMPGALTPTEIVTAWQAGADVVKIFPCSALGGASYLKALKAPLPQVEMIPTGGVSLSTASEFIAAGAWALGVGSDLANVRAIRDSAPEKVTAVAAEYVSLIEKARRG